jgi:hypothetical protein
MKKRIELGSDFFGANLLYGYLNTYDGALKPCDFEYDYYENGEGHFEDGSDVDEYEFDYDGYKQKVNEVLKHFFEKTVFEKVFKPLGFERLIYENLNKPREYNFTTDKVYFELEYDTEKFNVPVTYKCCNSQWGFYFEDMNPFKDWAINKIEELEKNPKFEQYLKDNFSSYDGFRSWTPNNINDLVYELYREDNCYRAINAFVAAWVDAEGLNVTEEDFENDYGYQELYGGLLFWNKIENAA